MAKRVLFNDRGIDVTQDNVDAIREANRHIDAWVKKNPPIVHKQPLEPEGELPSISVGLITFRRDNLLKLGLNSIVYSDYPKDKLEIIVLNDGTGPSTRQVVKRYTPHVKIKYYEIPLRAKPYAYYYDMRRKNFLIKQASHDIIFLTQAEVIQLPSNFKQIAAAFQQHEGHIKVKPKLIEQHYEARGKIYGVNGDVPGRINFDNLWKAAYGGKGFKWSTIKWSGSFGSAMRRESWEALGGFEEGTQISIEAEIYSRLLRRNWKAVELHKAHMIHLEHERDFKSDKWVEAVRRVGKTPLQANRGRNWGVIKEAKLVQL
jgi:glycosyltransferase involved in cell wall biosynthesis